MVLEIVTQNDVTIIGLPRRLDSASSPAAGDELKPIMDGKPGRIIFDFSKTEYISSAGLRIIINTTRAIHKDSGKVVLTSITPQVLRVFDIAGFLSIFIIADTNEEALLEIRK